MNPDQRKELVEQLEKLGPQRVRERLLGGKYHRFLQVPVVEAWLKEQEVNLTKDANDISRSVRNAAWWAVFISIISILISLIALLKSFGPYPGNR